MTGLEKILNLINLDSDQRSAEIIAEAQKQADEILLKAKQDAEKSVEVIKEKASDDSSLILSRSETACALECRKKLLNKKLEIINNCIDDAYQSLISLSDDEYSKLIADMIARFALKQSGEIILCPRDKKRISDMVTNAISDANLTISDKTIDADGGFVLVYGGIEVNCTFSALLENNREKLLDKAHELLF